MLAYEYLFDRGEWALHKHGFKNGWRDCAKKELQTNVYCIGEIYLIWRALWVNLIAGTM